MVALENLAVKRCEMLGKTRGRPNIEDDLD
jgi:hypothetical protein